MLSRNGSVRRKELSPIYSIAAIVDYDQEATGKSLQRLNEPFNRLKGEMV
jgi:hypothetical protein